MKTIFDDTYRLSKEQNYEQVDPGQLITKKKLLYYQAPKIMEKPLALILKF